MGSNHRLLVFSQALRPSEQLHRESRDGWERRDSNPSWAGLKNRSSATEPRTRHVSNRRGGNRTRAVRLKAWGPATSRHALGSRDMSAVALRLGTRDGSRHSVGAAPRDRTTCRANRAGNGDVGKGRRGLPLPLSRAGRSEEGAARPGSTLSPACAAPTSEGWRAIGSVGFEPTLACLRGRSSAAKRRPWIRATGRRSRCASGLWMSWGTRLQRLRATARPVARIQKRHRDRGGWIRTSRTSVRGSGVASYPTPLGIGVEGIEPSHSG